MNTVVPVVIGLIIAGVLVFGVPPVRRLLLTGWIFSIFQKIMPPISRTEREALEAGNVWWEKSLFAGRPDWKALKKVPDPRLTEKEKAFLDGPVEELCRVLDDWEITDRLHDLPAEAWSIIKKEKFFGMIIPEEYEGLGFSPFAHSEVLVKIASRSITAAVTVMVPNSLGPAELLLHYGTEEQKNRYLPGLARGEEIPCFALTEPEAGSDAAAMKATGFVERGIYGGKEILGIRLNWEKRYITLAPVATVMGLAFHLYDPDHLLSDNEDPGITVGLIPTDLPGVHTGSRHDPISIPFQNGPVYGEDVFVPLDVIVGGAPYAGHGWQMLMERLGIGRGISLPSLSTAAAKLAARATGGYARIRQQFHLPVALFEGVEEALSPIAGHAYSMDATRRFTVAAIMEGEAPSLASAIAKYNLTERMRLVVNHAMDIQGGGAIILGPRNFMGRVYQSIPLGITVEGANILTRSLIIFGQGIIRAHPFVRRELEAVGEKDRRLALRQFDRAFTGHVLFTSGLFLRTIFTSLTGGVFLPAPGIRPVKKYYRRVGRLSRAFALAGDVAMLSLGGELKRKEKLTGRLADVLSNLYIAAATLKRFEAEGSLEEDLDLVSWALEDSLFRAQESLVGFCRNLPVPLVGLVLCRMIFPLGKPFRAPDDRRGARVARVLQEPGDRRDRLTAGLYRGHSTEDPIYRVDLALIKALEAKEVEKKIAGAMKKGLLKAKTSRERLQEALEKGILNRDEILAVEVAAAARKEVITVDEFPADYWSNRYEN